MSLLWSKRAKPRKKLVFLDSGNELCACGKVFELGEMRLGLGKAAKVIVIWSQKWHGKNLNVIKSTLHLDIFINCLKIMTKLFKNYEKEQIKEAKTHLWKAETHFQKAETHSLITITELEKGWHCARASKRLVEIRPATQLKSGKSIKKWRILSKIFKKVPDMSGGRQNRPIQLTEILNIPKFSVWQIRKNARSHAWIAWSEPTLKSTRKSGRHYSESPSVFQHGHGLSKTSVGSSRSFITGNHLHFTVFWSILKNGS